jgi:hypothetical protein
MPTKRVVIGSQVLSLDARPDRLDLRDRPYLPPLGNLPPQWPPPDEIDKLLPAYAASGLILDQGKDGACTGFGLAAVINYLNFRHGLALASKSVRKVSPAMLYQLARLYDEWPGEDYEGSSCRGALKGWHRHGVCREDLWPFKRNRRGQRVHVAPKEDPRQRDSAAHNWDVDALSCTLGVYYRIDVRSIVDMQAAIRSTGAIYVAATVHEGWGVPARDELHGHDDLVRIQPVAKPKQPGGHAFAIVGYDASGFVVQNSWGDEWGSLGFALLPYEEWIMYGRDAWTLTLGVPRLPPGGNVIRTNGATIGITRSPRFLVSYGPGGDKASTDRATGLITTDDALTRRFRGTTSSDHQPLDSDVAYRHAILLDRGLPIRNDVTAENAAAALTSAVLTNPLAWLKANRSTKLLVYVHGGLNSESDSITRIRVMAPYALSNGIYPLFVTWRSGPLETLTDLAEESAEQIGPVEPEAGSWADRVTETTDRFLEIALRGPGGALWEQMKSNAIRASDDERGGVRLMLPSLLKLREELPKLEIHLIGHSAGAIVLGTMLMRMKEVGLNAASVRLFAPACTTRFALQNYVPAIRQKVLAAKDFHIHVLSDQNEQDDEVGPYRKSLLYLVSRSFEEHKTPLLGMAKSFDPATARPDAADDVWAPEYLRDVVDWQAFWNSLGTSNLEVLAAHSVSDGVRSIESKHGCFDNSVDIVGRALGYIVNPAAPVKLKIERLDY